MNTRTIATAAAATIALGATLSLAAPAQASGGNKVVRTGSCSGASDWKLKVGPDNGRLETEGEVDSNKVGQTWNWSIVHNGSVSASGSKVTVAPSGSFTVRRSLVDLKGTDTVTFKASNPKTGETCRGSVSL